MEEARENNLSRADCAKCDFASDALCSIFAENGQMTTSRTQHEIAHPVVKSQFVEGLAQQVGALAFSIVPSGGNIFESMRALGVNASQGWFMAHQKVSLTDKRNDSKAAYAAIKFQSASDMESGWNFGGDMMIVHFPRSTFRGLEPHIEALCSGVAEFGANALLSAYLESLWNSLADLTESEQLVVEAVTTKLVRSCIMRVHDSIASSSAASRNRLESAKQYIDERITQPGLTVESIQNWLGVSRRQLYSLFEPYGGVARYIMSQRLKRCQVALDDPAELRPIGRIAEQYGIDPTRVVSLFRQEFGYGPDHVRNGVPYCGAANVGDTTERVVCAA